MKKFLHQPWFGILTVGFSIAFFIWIAFAPIPFFAAFMAGWLCGNGLIVGGLSIISHVQMSRTERLIAEYKREYYPDVTGI